MQLCTKSIEAEVNRSLSVDDKIFLYQEMVRMRRFEERAVRSYQQGKIGGFCHTYIGQEALAMGTISVLGPDDHIITAYRCHAHALAVGMNMKEMMAELYGKKTGCSQGKGGSMHFFDPKRNFWGGHGIVGGQTPLGLGIAFALKYQGRKGACLCYLGDGAVNQGPLYESYNIASLWNVPVVYVIENNNYSMGTSLERSSAGLPLAKRAEGFGIDWAVIEGSDLFTVRAKTVEALERAYNESRPTVLEINTYRYRGHSMSDPDKTYRAKEEIEEYRKTRDPILMYEKYLVTEGILDEEKIARIDESAKAEAEEAHQFAEESPYPSAEDIRTSIYWEEDNSEEKKSTGRLYFS